MNVYNLCIGGIGISLETDRCLEMTEAFSPFLSEIAKPDYRVVFHRVDSLSVIPEETVSEELCCRTHPDGKGGFLRSFFDAPRYMTPYSLVTESACATCFYFEVFCFFHALYDVLNVC